jgi:hypothetical protein
LTDRRGPACAHLDISPAGIEEAIAVIGAASAAWA